MSASAPVSLLHTGSHLVTIEGCVLHFRFEGDILLEDVTQLLALMEQVRASEGILFTLNDISRLGSISSAARR